MNLLEIITRLIEASERTRRERTLRRTEKWLAGKMSKAFQAQEKVFFAALPGPVVQEAVGDEAPFPTTAQWNAALTKAQDATEAAFVKPMEDGILLSFDMGMDFAVQGWGASLDPELMSAFTVEHPGAIEYSKNHAAEQVTKINETTRSYLNTVITDGVEQGKSYNQISKEIRDRYSDFSTGRAKRIAVFETGDAYEAGNEFVAKELEAEGLEMEKSWLTVGDNRVRPEHSSNEAEGWIPIDQSFGSGDDRSPTDPGCRCSMLYRVKPVAIAA